MNSVKPSSICYAAIQVTEHTAGWDSLDLTFKTGVRGPERDGKMEHCGQ